MWHGQREIIVTCNLGFSQTTAMFQKVYATILARNHHNEIKPTVLTAMVIVYM